MAYDALILEQAINITSGEVGDPVKVEITERRAEVVALGKNGAPTQSRLETFQTELFE